MNVPRNPTKRGVALLVGLLLGGAGGARAQERDDGWPRELLTNKGLVVIYQPQTTRSAAISSPPGPRSR